MTGFLRIVARSAQNSVCICGNARGFWGVFAGEIAIVRRGHVANRRDLTGCRAEALVQIATNDRAGAWSAGPLPPSFFSRICLTYWPGMIYRQQMGSRIENSRQKKGASKCAIGDGSARSSCGFCAKQSQFPKAQMSLKLFMTRDYES